MSFFKKIGNAVSSVVNKTIEYGIEKPFEAVVVKPIEKGVEVGGDLLSRAAPVVGQATDVIANNPQLADAVGGYFGVPNASSFFDRKEQPMPTTAPSVITVPSAQAPKSDNSMIIIIGAGIALVLAVFLMRKK